MREEGENRWLFVSHVKRVVPEDEHHMVIGGIRNKMANEDLPVEEHLKITIDGEWKITLYDTMTGEIEELYCTYENGKTILSRNMFDHDSLLLFMKPGRREESLNYNYVRSEECAISFAHETDITLSEPNVCILDLAGYRFDDGEWNPEEEILRIDNKFRELLGYPFRMEAFAQPWTNDKEEGFEHTLSLRFSLHSLEDLSGVSLAMENDETARILLD